MYEVLTLSFILFTTSLVCPLVQGVVVHKPRRRAARDSENLNFKGTLQYFDSQLKNLLQKRSLSGFQQGFLRRMKHQ